MGYRRYDNPHAPARGHYHREPKRLREVAPDAAGRLLLAPVWLVLRWARRLGLLAGVLLLALELLGGWRTQGAFGVTLVSVAAVLLSGPWMVARWWRNHRGYLWGPRQCATCNTVQRNDNHTCVRCGRVLTTPAYTTRLPWYRLGKAQSAGPGRYRA